MHWFLAGFDEVGCTMGGRNNSLGLRKGCDSDWISTMSAVLFIGSSQEEE